MQKKSAQGETHLLRQAALNFVFRANPTYELVPFDRLSPPEQEALKGLQQEPDFYGILRLRGKGSAVPVAPKSVNRETALLFLTLQEPGPLPFYVTRRFESGIREVITMVLDGVLEVRQGEGFLSGPAASNLFFSVADSSGSSPSTNAIQQLSEKALRFAEALDVNDTMSLAARLYGYNRIPLSPAWLRRFQETDSVWKHLCPDSQEIGKWMVRTGESSRDWIVFTRREKAGRFGRPPAWYKLYVSPSPHSLQETMRGLLLVLRRHPVEQFKVAGDATGLLRPDKIVAYFASREDLARAADELRRNLNGIPAQGVPFTAGITPNGLLSWGVDPPPETFAGMAAQESWRQWVTLRLAAALMAAKQSASSTVRPYLYALDRVKIEGIDVENWIPSGGVWKRTAEARDV